MNEEINLQQLRNENQDEKIFVHRGVLDGIYNVEIIMSTGENERTAVIVRRPGEPKELVQMSRLVVKFSDVTLEKNEALARKRESNFRGAVRRRLSPEGAAAKRRKLDWNATRDTVRKRRKCEVCGSPIDYKNADPAHIFGRGNQIPREIADTPELVACACRPCHTYVDTHPESEQTIKLKWKGVRRFAYKNKLEWTPYRDRGWTPLQAINDLIRITKGEQSVLELERYNDDTDQQIA